MTPALLLVATGVGVLALWRRCPRAAALLITSAVTEAARLALGPHRATWTKPYEGWRVCFWLVSEIIPAALPPSVAIGLAAGAWSGVFALMIAIGATIAIYPTMRGDALLAPLLAYYASLYLTASAIHAYRWIQGGGLMRDEAAQICFLLTGVAGVALLGIAGPSYWSEVRITYGAGIAVAAIVLLRPEP